MSLFVWGSCANGQLGLGGVEEEKITIPKLLSDVDGGDKRCVKEIACGIGHSLLVLESGGVFTCGSNEFSQLGREGPCKRFRQVLTLNEVEISQIACGAYSCLCLSSDGKVFSWGCNSFGQLGREDRDDQSVKIVKALTSHDVVHIVCGERHALCLTRSSEVFAWGSNEDGQLGVGLKNVKVQPIPVKILSLQTVSIRQLACGGNYSYCLSVSGVLFCWGQNNFGQLGLGDTVNRDVPHPCASLKSQPVIRVSCGEAHTTILTRDGGVFTCGSGGCGQLGHNNRNNVLLPTKIFEFMGRDVTDIVCGRRHTMALIPSSGQLMTFGLGASGQLGVGDCSDSLNPAVLKGSWVSSSALRCKREKESQSYIIQRMFCGFGDSCFLVAVKANSGKSLNTGNSSSNLHIDYLTDSNISFLLSAPSLRPLENQTQKISRTFSVAACVNASLLSEDHFCVNSRNHGVDLDKYDHLFKTLTNLPADDALRSTVKEALLILVNTVKQRNFPCAECLRVFLIIPQAFCLLSEKFSNIILPYCEAVNLLESAPKKYIEKWFTIMPLRHMHNSVNHLRKSLVVAINEAIPPNHGACSRQFPKPVSSRNVLSILNVLKLIHVSNSARESSLERDAFYVTELPDLLDISAEYYHWIVRRNQPLHSPSLCDFPFIFDGISKSLMLRMDAKIQMAKAIDRVHTSNVIALFNRAIVIDLPEMVFRIRREHILSDTVTNLEMINVSDLKKPLKVIFEGEEAQDEGGVRKEYLMLFFKELMNPNFAMFKYYEESRMLWFHEYTFEDPKRFALVGTMCGLSIYNSSLVDLNFPIALYKKLLSRPLCLDDLKELDPVLGRSLQSLLDYDRSDFEELFSLTFVIEMESFGEKASVELKDNGKNIPVTLANKNEYVDLYLNYVFDKSCKEQYRAFHDAFHAVFACDHESLLTLFEPSELQTLLVGNEEYDWSTLRSSTTYKGEFWHGHPVIDWFWGAFNEFTTREKKKFLLFLTGNDRVPIQGMNGIKLFIQPSDAGDQYLPVAHTCFNLLDLPIYSSKYVLSEKVKLAIEQSEGFGLV